MKKRLFLLLAIGLGLAGCATQPQRPAEAPNRHILILTTQGVDPKLDTVQYNSFVQKVSASFSEPLVKSLRGMSYVPFTVVDQEMKYDTGQKLAIHAARHAARKAIILLLETQRVGTEQRMNLKVQFVEQDFIREGDRVTGIKTLTVRDKTYFLHSSVTGDNPVTIPALAADYVAFLKAQRAL